MQAQLHGPLRVALTIFCLCTTALAVRSGVPSLAGCCILGSLSLLALARWPAKAPARARYPLPLLLLSPLAILQVQSLSDGLRCLLAVLALGFWAGMGLRRPKAGAKAQPQFGPWDLLALLGLFALWAALGFMGGSLAGLLWSSEEPISSCLSASAVFTLIYHHARFYLCPSAA